MEVLQRTANRGSISTGYDIDYSIKFEADNSEQLYRTPSSDGNMKTWTYSVWFKRTELGASQTLIAALDTYMYFETNDTAWLNLRSASTNFFMATNRTFRDTSAWYHAVIACDTTDSTAADRLKLYINGVRETSFSNNTYENIDGDDDTGMNKATVHRIGQYSNYGSKFSGYMAEANLIDGQALAPTAFGEFDDDTGIWKPKKYTGTYGTNGFYLDFADASDLGDDESGNGNDFTEGGITSADQATDTPTNNYATWNALFHATGANDGYLGALKITQGATEAAGISGWDTAVSTIAVSQGKWYAEFYITGSGTPVYTMIGAVQAEKVFKVLRSGGYYVGHSDASGYTVSLYGQNGNVYPAQDDGNNDSVFNAGAIISVALDMDNHKIYWRENGTWLLSDDPASNNGYALGWTGDTYFAVSQYDSDNSLQANFGGFHANTVSSGNTDADGYGNFEYSVPSGYYALNTKNLAEYG